MINFDDYTNESKLKHNPNWPCITDHPYRILITGGSGSGKTNALFNLINNQPDIDKLYLYAKDLYGPKYQFLINKRESTGLKHFNDSQTFIEYLNDMHDVYKNINHYNPHKVNKVLIVFDDIIADIINNKKQIKAIHDQGRIKTIKKYSSDDEDSPWISKQNEIFNELVDKSLNEINELDKKS